MDSSQKDTTTPEERRKVYHTELIRFMKASQKVVVDESCENSFMVYSLKDSTVIREWLKEDVELICYWIVKPVFSRKEPGGTFYETLFRFTSKHFFECHSMTDWLVETLLGTHFPGENTFYRREQPEHVPRNKMNQWMWTNVLKDVPLKDPDTIKQELSVLFTYLNVVKERGRCVFFDVKKEDLRSFQILNVLYDYTVNLEPFSNQKFKITVSWT